MRKLELIVCGRIIERQISTSAEPQKRRAADRQRADLAAATHNGRYRA
jgi:hypothetical protein